MPDMHRHIRRGSPRGRAAALAALLALTLGLPRVAAAGPVQASAPGQLLGRLPAEAWAVAAVDLTALPFSERWLDTDPAMKAELQQLLRARLGLDLTAVQGAALFLRGAKESPAVAVLLSLPPGSGALKGKARAQHRGVKLVDLELQGMVAAQVRGGVVAGEAGAVRAAVDVSLGKAQALTPASTLGALIKGPGQDAIALAGVDPAMIPDPQLQQLVRQFGVRLGTLWLDRKSKLTVQVQGSPGQLGLALAMIHAALGEARKKLTEQRDQGSQGSVLEAAAGIVSYHQGTKLLDEVTPRLQGDRLVSTYQIPDLQSPASTMAIVGILAAVAIPSFVKYQQAAKSSEVMAALARINLGARAFYAQHGRRGAQFSFPPSTPWSPGVACCKQPGSTCQPQARAFSHKTWKALDFSMASPHRYQYRFTSRGQGKRATFTAEARGDLDCDGAYSRFRYSGELDASGEVQIRGPIIENQLE